MHPAFRALSKTKLTCENTYFYPGMPLNAFLLYSVTHFFLCPLGRNIAIGHVPLAEIL